MRKSKVPQRKILISGYYGFDNFGDEAILGTLVQKLKGLNVRVRVLSSSPQKTAALHDVKSTYSFSLLSVVYQIIECDVLVSGGGSLLQDLTSIKSLIYYIFIINLALLFKKKVIIFAQGLGPINNKCGALLTKNTLKRCTLISVRDKKSRFILDKWGIDCNLVCDPLFTIDTPKPTPLNRVGVQLRSFKTLTRDLLVKLAEQINKNFADKEIEIFSFQDSLDLSVCQEFEKILNSINPQLKVTLWLNQTSNDIIDKISKLDYMIAMRFHAVLLSIKYGIKTFAICYDVKVEKLAKEVQIPYVSMLVNEDYDNLFEQLINMEKSKLIAFSQTKYFDWNAFKQIINPDGPTVGL